MIRQLVKRFSYKFKYKNLFIHPTVQISGNGEFRYKENSVIAEFCNIVLNGKLDIGANFILLNGSEIDAVDIVIGDDVSIQRNSSILARVKIGSYTICGPNLHISSGTHHFKIQPSINIRDQDSINSDADENAPVIIGEDCWFGRNVVVVAGVEIGKGCIIGANSVVNKNIPPYSVIAGCPAKIISQRLSFIPPNKITAANDNIPYFYEGFKTRLKDLSLDGIKLSRPRFKIALNTDDSQFIFLRTTGISKLWSGDQEAENINGDMKFLVSKLLLDKGMICFSAKDTEWERALIREIWAK